MKMMNVMKTTMMILRVFLQDNNCGPAARRLTTIRIADSDVYRTQGQPSVSISVIFSLPWAIHVDGIRCCLTDAGAAGQRTSLSGLCNWKQTRAEGEGMRARRRDTHHPPSGNRVGQGAHLPTSIKQCIHWHGVPVWREGRRTPALVLMEGRSQVPFEDLWLYKTGYRMNLRKCSVRANFLIFKVFPNFLLSLDFWRENSWF